MFLPSNITLQFGDSGDFVMELQRRLAAVGKFNEAGINGFFDGVTVNGVTAFQSSVGIRADGVAGPETLRRLNGVISGETSGSTDKKEEEAQQANATAVANQQYLADHPHMLSPAAPETADRVVPEVMQAAAAGAVLGEAAHTLHADRPQPALSPQEQMLQQQLQQQMMDRQFAAQQQQQQTPQNMGDMLAQMLVQQTAGNPSPQPQQAQAGTPAAHAQGAPAQQAQAAEQAAAPAAEAPKSLVGRALQKMDAMLQKLNDYFEAKLPPDVMREVKQAGLVMAQSGVKEAPIPSGPEPVRGLTPPARGPEQQQVPQRG